MRLLESVHLPFDKLMALSRVEGLRCSRSSGFRPAAKAAGWIFSMNRSEAGFSTAYDSTTSPEVRRIIWSHAVKIS
jgi:hypothetical protein